MLCNIVLQCFAGSFKPNVFALSLSSSAKVQLLWSQVYKVPKGAWRVGIWPSHRLAHSFPWGLQGGPSQSVAFLGPTSIHPIEMEFWSFGPHLGTFDLAMWALRKAQIAANEGLQVAWWSLETPDLRTNFQTVFPRELWPRWRKMLLRSLLSWCLRKKSSVWGDENERSLGETALGPAAATCEWCRSWDVGFCSEGNNTADVYLKGGSFKRVVSINSCHILYIVIL